MRFVSFERDDGPGYGLVRGEAIVDLSARAYPTLRHAIAADALGELTAWAEDQSAGLALAQASLLPVIPDAEKIMCFGLNYRKRNPAGGDVTEMEHPLYFLKPPGALVGHGSPLVKPKVSDDFDFEAELAVIISKPGRHIAREDALEYVAGYTCLNDGSVRDWQKHSVSAGKNFDGSGSCGPWMVTADEIDDPDKLRVISRLNGREMQNESAEMMFFDIAGQIEYLSIIMELHPGDIIATGSPEGSGGQRDPQVFMKAGDTIEIEIPGIGVLSNPVVNE